MTRSPEPSGNPTPNPATTSNPRRWLRRALWILGGLAALWGVAWLAVPPLAKSQIEKIASEKLGRKVSLGAVDFKPWTLELTLTDLAIATADGSADQLRIQRIYADAELQSILRLAPVVDAIAVDAPRIRLTHLGGGRYDIDDILARLAQPADAPKGEPARFALYNIALTGGSLDFTDKTVNKTHELRDFSLQLPFLSNLASQRDVTVAPHLAFALNGSRFDSSARSTPFAQTRKTDATLKISTLDLAPYLGYWPASLPVRLQSAVLQADVRVAFEQADKPRVVLSGSVEAGKLAVAAARDGSPLFGFDQLRVQMTDVQPLAQLARIGSIELAGPRLSVARDKAGRINLQQLAAAPASPKPAPANPAPAGAATPWKVELGSFRLSDGAVTWKDGTTVPAAALLLDHLQLETGALAWPMAAPVAFKGSGQLQGSALGFSGSATDQAASVTASLSALPLSLAAPYLSEYLEPALSGQLSAELSLGWKAPDLRVGVQRLTLADLALGQAAKGKTPPLVSAKKFEVTGAQIDMARATASIGKLALSGPQLRVARDAQGQWMFERWLKARPAASQAVVAPAEATGRAQPAAPVWSVTLGELLLEGGSVGFQDLTPVRPVALEVSGLRVQMKNIVQGGKPGPRPASPLEVSARVAAGQLEPGKLEYKGNLGLAPLSARGTLMAERLPVHALEAYAADLLNVELLRADASFRGQVQFAQTPAGPSLKLAGDTAVEDFRANAVQAGAQGGLKISEELLSWKALGLRGLEVSLAPGTATQVQVRETALSDFYARIIVNDQGRINLQDLVRSSPAVTSTTAATSPTVAGPAPVIAFGPVSLVNGKVLFSDRFVKPNYSADLSELNGRLSAFSSVSPEGSPQLADLELRGRAEGTASLEVLGKLNPLAKPLALDIKGKVRDLELPPLSPYSIKYAGYGIQRGKLSVDVAYLVKPDGQLTASNKVVLNQLSFGDKVEGAPNSLPVKLAVALLADRNGVIDIDLPVSGSLNDPQFSVGGIIFKVIVNLVVKAITAPFALLGGLFGGGGEEMSMVAFNDGSAVITPEAAQGLDKVAKALTDRPSLKLTVVGTSSLEVEREGYKRERLKALVAAEKRRDRVLAGTTGTAVLTVSAEEYPELLKQVYKRTDIPKPRNLVGMAKDIPVPEMEALLLANVLVNDDVIRELAVQRGVAVKDYLAGKQLPVERLFLGAAKAVPPEAKWRPRAELNLAQ